MNNILNKKEKKLANKNISVITALSNMLRVYSKNR